MAAGPARKPRPGAEGSCAARSRCTRSTGSPTRNGTARPGSRPCCGFLGTSVLHDPDRLRRPVARLSLAGRSWRRLASQSDAVHGLPRTQGRIRLPQMIQPGPSLATRRGGRAVRRAVHLQAFNVADQVLMASGLHGASAGAPAPWRSSPRWSPPRWPSSAMTGSTGSSGSCWSSRSRATRSSRWRSSSGMRGASRHHPRLHFYRFMAHSRRGGVQHHVRALRVGLLALPAAEDVTTRHHRCRVLRRVRSAIC